MGMRSKTSIQPLMKKFKQAGLKRQTYERIPGRDLYRVSKPGDIVISRTYDYVNIEFASGLGSFAEMSERVEKTKKVVVEVLNGADLKWEDCDSYFKVFL